MSNVQGHDERSPKNAQKLDGHFLLIIRFLPSVRVLIDSAACCAGAIEVLFSLIQDPEFLT